jgi:hypothetical protein
MEKRARRHRAESGVILDIIKNSNCFDAYFFVYFLKKKIMFSEINYILQPQISLLSSKKSLN